MTDNQPAVAGEFPAIRAHANLANRLRAVRRSVPVRSAVIAVQLMLVYVLSQKDATFFYQQF